MADTIRVIGVGIDREQACLWIIFVQPHKGPDPDMTSSIFSNSSGIVAGNRPACSRISVRDIIVRPPGTRRLRRKMLDTALSMKHVASLPQSRNPKIMPGVLKEIGNADIWDQTLDPAMLQGI